MPMVEQSQTELFVPSQPTLATLRFRLAQRRDLQPLHSACYPQQPFYEFRALFQRLLRRQEKGHSYWVVAISEALDQSVEQIVGSGQLVVYPHSAELTNLVVTTSYRNQGIGTALIAVLLAIARDIDLVGVEIGVESDNQRALALYQRLGFEPERRLQLPDERTAIILYKAL